MSIVFEKFTEKHIEEAIRLTMAELGAERTYCPDLPCHDFEGRLKKFCGG